MRIVVLDGYGLNPGDLSWTGFEDLGDLTVYDRTDSLELMERAKGAEVLITNKTPITAEHMNSLPQLKYIGVLATGYNVVDIDAAKMHDIVVTNIPAYSTFSVAQMVFALLLTITQRVEYYANENKKGRWTNNMDFCYWDTPLIELAGKRMGIVGFGNIGKATAHIAQAMGMKVCLYTSKSQMDLPQGMEKVDMDTLFSTCDVISLHCPLTPDTKGMVDAHRLGMMKSNAILINTGRGTLINEQDLANALNEGRIAGAGLDVLSTEPPLPENPLLTARNCYITPHIAWATREARMRLMDIAVHNLNSFLTGNIINNVVK